MFNKYFKPVLLKAKLFAIKPSLNYKGQAHYTICGGFISLIIFSLLLFYLIWQLVHAFNTPNISSFPLFAQFDEELNINGVTICVNDIGSNLEAIYDVNAIMHLSYPFCVDKKNCWVVFYSIVRKIINLLLFQKKNLKGDNISI